MDFKYIKNLTTDTADIYLHRDIGEDWDEISSSQVIWELDYILKYLPEVKKIKAHINCPGGGVIQGFGIFSKMMDVNKNVVGVTLDTYNDGVAASTAGWLLMAGKTIYMQDFALMMLHNLSMGDKSFLTPKETEILQKFKDSIITIFVNRTGLDRAAISTMMDKETWLDSSQALEMGFVDKVLVSSYGNKTPVPANATPADMWNIVNSISNQISEKNTTPKKIIKKKKVQAIPQKMENAMEVIVTETSTQTNNTMAENPVTFPLELQKILSVNNMADAVSAISEMKAQNKALETKATNAEARAEKAEKELSISAQEKAVKLIKDAISTKRITAAEESSWLELANQNYNATEKALMSIPPVIMFTQKIAEAENNGNTEDRSNWSYKDWSKKDSKGLAEMQKNDPDAFENLKNFKPTK